MQDRGRHHHSPQQPQRIDHQLPFAPFPRLASGKAYLHGLGGGLNALTLDTPGGGCRLPSLAPARYSGSRLNEERGKDVVRGWQHTQ
jgi:hypothetical protein